MTGISPSLIASLSRPEAAPPNSGPLEGGSGASSLAQCEAQPGVINGLPGDTHPASPGASGQVPTSTQPPWGVSAFPEVFPVLIAPTPSIPTSFLLSPVRPLGCHHAWVFAPVWNVLPLLC